MSLDFDLGMGGSAVPLPSFGRRDKDGLPSEYLPTHEMVERLRDDGNPIVEGGKAVLGWVGSFFSAIDRMLGGQSLKALVAGDFEQALKNNPISQALAALPGVSREDLGIVDYDARKIRESWGDTSDQSGVANFLVNAALDIALDMSSFVSFFGKVSQLGKTANPYVASMAEGLMTRAIKSGESALAIWRIPRTEIGFVVPTPKAFDLAVARNLERAANFVNTSKLLSPVVKTFSPLYAGIGDIKDAAGNVTIAGSVMRERVKQIVSSGDSTRTAWMEQFMPVLRKFMDTPVGRIAAREGDVGSAIVLATELGISKADDLLSIHNAIEYGPVYAKGQAQSKRLLRDNQEAQAIYKEMQRYEPTAYADWTEKYPHAAFPDDVLDYADSLGLARRDIDHGLDLRGTEGTPIDIALEQVIPKTNGVVATATDGMRARADAVAGAGRQGVEALVEAKRQAKDLFSRIVKSGEVTLADIGEAADAGRAMLERLGNAEVMSGLLGSMTELYSPRFVSKEVSDLVQKHWLSAADKLEKADAGFNPVASFMRERRFDNMTSFEANYIAHEIGTRFTGYQPLKNLAAEAAQKKAMGVMAHIFDLDFIKALRKRGDAVDAVKFFSENPMHSWYRRIEQSGRVVQQQHYVEEIFADDSMFVLADDAAKDVTLETVEVRLQQNMRGFLVDNSGAATKVRPGSINRIVGNIIDDNIEASGHVARDALREHVTERLLRGKIDAEDVISELKGDLDAADLTPDQLSNYVPTSPAGHNHVKAVKDLRSKQDEVKSLLDARAEAETILADAKSVKSKFRDEFKAARAAQKALEERTALLRGEVGDLGKAAELDAKAAKHSEKVDRLRAKGEEKFGGYVGRGSAAEKMVADHYKRINQTKEKAIRLRKRADDIRASQKFGKYADEAEAAANVEEDLLANLKAEVDDADGLYKVAQRAKSGIEEKIAAARKLAADAERKASGFKAAIRDEIADIRAARDALLKDARKSGKDAGKEITRIVNQKLSKHRMAEEIAYQRLHAENGAVPLDELLQNRPDLWEKIKERHGDLRIKWMDAGVAEGLFGKNGMLKRLSQRNELWKFLKGMETVTWHWKAHTALNPLFLGSRVRDLLSTSWHMAQNGAAGVFREIIPGWGDAYRLAKATGKHMRGDATEISSSVFRREIDGAQLTGADLLSAMQTRGILTSGHARDVLLGSGEDIAVAAGHNPGTFAKKLLSSLNPNAKKNWLIQKGFRFAEYFDNWAKIGGFMAQWRSGKSLDDAAAFVRQYAYDPGASNLLTSAEKALRSTVAPFYAYTKFAVQRSVNLALTRPGTLSWWEHVVKNSRESLADVTPEEMELVVPEFIRDNLGVPIGRDDAGNPTFLMFGNFHPAAELIKATSAIEQALQGKDSEVIRLAGEKLSPFVRLPLEKMWNESFYSQRPIERYEGQNVEFLGMSMSKFTAEILRSVRLLNEVDRLGIFSSDDITAMARAGDNSLLKLVTSAFSPLPTRSYTIDEERQLSFAEERNKRDYATQKGELRRTINRGDGRATNDNIKTLQTLMAKSMLVTEAVEKIKERRALRELNLTRQTQEPK